MEGTPIDNGRRMWQEHRGLRGRLAGIFSSPTPEQQCSEQVAKLTEQLQKQSELKETYKARLENAQEYLRFCLEVAQQHGFLHLMSTSNDGKLSPRRDDEAEAATAADNDEGERELIEAPPSDPYLAATRKLAVQHGWSVAPDEIELHEMIGRGTTADIHRATWRGLDVVVKWMRPELFLSNPSAEAFFAQELDVLSRQRHPDVLRLMGA
ncbi:hypothetical protein ACQ4PT_063791 [Festuca glaucescens]